MGYYPMNVNNGEMMTSPVSPHHVEESKVSGVETHEDKASDATSNKSSFTTQSNEDSHNNAHVAAMQHAAMMAAPYMFTSGMPVPPPGTYPYPPQAMDGSYAAGSPQLPWGWPYFPAVNYHHPPVASAPPPPTLQLPMNVSSKSHNGGSGSNSSTPHSATSSYQPHHKRSPLPRNNSNNSFHSSSHSGKVSLNAKGVPIAPTLFTDSSPVHAGNNHSSSSSSHKVNRKDTSPLPSNQSVSPTPSPTTNNSNSRSQSNLMEPSLESLPIFTSEMKIAIPSSGPLGRRGGKGSRPRLPPFLPPNNNPSNNPNNSTSNGASASSQEEVDRSNP